SGPPNPGCTTPWPGCEPCSTRTRRSGPILRRDVRHDDRRSVRPEPLRVARRGRRASRARPPRRGAGAQRGDPSTAVVVEPRKVAPRGYDIPPTPLQRPLGGTAAGSRDAGPARPGHPVVRYRLTEAAAPTVRSRSQRDVRRDARRRYLCHRPGDLRSETPDWWRRLRLRRLLL